MKTGWRLKANLAFFVVMALGLIYAMATQVLTLLEDRVSVFAMFPDAGGVFTNQEVTYRGVTVGQVGRMEVVPQGVRIELRIDEDYEIPAEDVRARVMFKSAVGEQFVDILPEATGAPYLQDGDVIPRARTDIPVSTQELLATLEAVLQGVPPEALKGAIDSLGQGLAGRGRDLGTILESSADLAELFAERAPEMEGILRKGTTVGRAFLNSRREFARAIDELVTVSETLEGSTGDLRRLLVGTNLTSDEIRALVNSTRPQLHRLLRQLAEVNELQAEHAGDLNRLFLHLPSGLDAVVKSFEPKTGLVRFGSIFNEHAEPEACAYGTKSRSPRDRSPKLPPKNARCGRGRTGPSSAAPARSTQSDTSDADVALPSRLSQWSWTLPYLNSINPSL